LRPSKEPYRGFLLSVWGVICVSTVLSSFFIRWQQVRLYLQRRPVKHSSEATKDTTISFVTKTPSLQRRDSIKKPGNSTSNSHVLGSPRPQIVLAQRVAIFLPRRDCFLVVANASRSLPLPWQRCIFTRFDLCHKPFSIADAKSAPFIIFSTWDAPT
jgi:hypothetical protein